jgi:formate dehydrogenase subunit gamma
MLHPWVGVAFALLVAQLFEKWHSDMRAEVDSATRKQLLHVGDEHALASPTARFNIGQKRLFWVMTWAALALLLSGFVLWFPHLIPPPRAALRQTAALVHSIAALVTIGAFIVHLYIGVAAVVIVPGIPVCNW